MVIRVGGLLLRILEAERRREILWTVSGGANQSGARAVAEVKAISTGSFGFDKALGIGGIPRGRLVEVYGPSGCGKTTLALQVAANAQKSGGTAAFIDAEHALDLRYSAKLGVQAGDLIVAKPDSGEQALELALSLVETGLVELVVIDSVAALVPENELASPMGEDHFSELEEMMGRGLRKLDRSVLRTGACVLFTNQIRHRSYATTGDPDITAGGRPLRFHAAVRMELSTVERVVESGNVIGNRVMMRVIKNRVAGGYRSAVAPMIHGEGFSKELELLEIATAHNVVQAGRVGFAYHGEPMTRSDLRDNPALVSEMMDEVRASARALRSKPVGQALEGQFRKMQSA